MKSGKIKVRRLIAGLVGLMLLLSACAATGLYDMSASTGGSTSTTVLETTISTATPTTTTAVREYKYSCLVTKTGKVILISKHSLYASVLFDNPVFETEQYLFRIYTVPGCWKGPGSVDLKYSMTLSYDDVVLDAVNNESDHVVIYASPFIQSTNAERSAFVVVGWFEEATDILLTFTDLETGNVVETQKYHIVYDTELEDHIVELIETVTY